MKLKNWLGPWVLSICIAMLAFPVLGQAQFSLSSIRRPQQPSLMVPLHVGDAICGLVSSTSINASIDKFFDDSDQVLWLDQVHKTTLILTSHPKVNEDWYETLTDLNQNENWVQLKATLKSDGLDIELNNPPPDFQTELVILQGEEIVEVISDTQAIFIPALNHSDAITPYIWEIWNQDNPFILNQPVILSGPYLKIIFSPECV